MPLDNVTKCNKNKQNNATTQRNNYHMSEHTHVPICPCLSSRRSEHAFVPRPPCFKRGKLKFLKKGSKKDLVLQYPSHPLPPRPGSTKRRQRIGWKWIVSFVFNTLLLHCLALVVEMNCQFCHIGSFAPLRPNTGEDDLRGSGLRIPIHTILMSSYHPPTIWAYQYLPNLCYLTTHQLYEDTTERQLYCNIPNTVRL